MNNILYILSISFKVGDFRFMGKVFSWGKMIIKTVPVQSGARTHVTSAQSYLFRLWNSNNSVL